MSPARVISSRIISKTVSFSTGLAKPERIANLLCLQPDRYTSIADITRHDTGFCWLWTVTSMLWTAVCGGLMGPRRGRGARTEVPETRRLARKQAPWWRRRPYIGNRQWLNHRGRWTCFPSSPFWRAAMTSGRTRRIGIVGILKEAPPSCRRGYPDKRHQMGSRWRSLAETCRLVDGFPDRCHSSAEFEAVRLG